MSKQELEHKIIDSLKCFSSETLTRSSLKLFEVLGYNTSRQNPLDETSYLCFRDTFLSGDTRSFEDKAITSQWKYVDLLFQLSASEISSQIGFFDTLRVDKTIMESYLFFAIELFGQTYTRTELSQITREINKAFSMPVMVLFKYGPKVTLSVINRRLNERDENKDVLKKVTLVKDIDIINPHRAHIEILYDLSFDELYRINRFSNFVELHNAWQKTLDIKELNKRFYQDLSNWYFWAIDKVSFPDDAEKNVEIRNATSLIRIITRIIFIWFIKEKDLVPDILFNKSELKKILKTFNSTRSDDSYYRAILQNLFFGTLNQRMSERSFAKEGSFSDNKKEYGVKTLYRYADAFAISEADVIALFKDVPFLNGGLFDCLDKENDEGKVIYVDGFSRNRRKQAKVSDYLFFSDEVEEIDLNEVYGTKNKSYKVRGLLNTLSGYKFTITENTPIEEEIALDPELLGKVFENLLASYNPETQITARKQTGSFYTHSDIVNFMVDESLVAYFCEKLDENGFKGKETKIRKLLTYSENLNPFDLDETTVLIAAIDNCKILDPACGSGAFPMGILHKLVYVLHKLDPNNEKWKERQIKKAMNLDDAIFSEHSVRDIEEAFQNNELDYGRKLYLIENCIYGVDIQPIAVQITKLRFFISLIIDQKKQPSKTNLGIRALPNLELKFVSANSLMGLDKPRQIMIQNTEVGMEKQISFKNDAIEKLEEALKQLRHKYFNARTRREKLVCQREDKEIRRKVSKLLIADGWKSDVASQITIYDPYDQNTSMSYFDPEYMFGLKKKFDIVIGNPPYIRQELIKDIKPILAKTYKVYNSTSDLYTYFYELTYNLLCENGISTFITNNSWIKNKYGTKLRKFFLDNTQMLYLINFEDAQNFEAAVVETNVLIFKKAKPSDDSIIRFAKTIPNEGSRYSLLLQNKLDSEGFVLGNNTLLGLKEKIKHKGKVLKNWDIDINYGIKSGFNEAFYIDGTQRQELINQDRNSAKIIKPLLRGREIKRWIVNGENNWIINPHNGLKSKGIKRINVVKDYPAIYYHLEQYKDKLVNRLDQGEHWTNLRNCAYLDDFEKEKVVWIVLSDRAKFAYDDEGYYSNDSTFIMTGKDLKYILAVLNSEVSEWYYDFLAPTSGMGTTMWKKAYIEQIPIVEASAENKKTVERLVDYIICERKQNGESSVLSFFENLINSIVYELYLPEEVKKANCEVLKHLANLPVLINNQNISKKHMTIQKVYSELSNPIHPVSIAMEKMKSVSEVRLIEGIDIT